MADSRSLNEPAIRAARLGDDVALQAVVRALAAELMPLASALTGANGEADALLGDTLSRVYERLDQLRGASLIVPWARRILVRRFLDQRRWSLRRPQCSIEGVEISTTLGTTPELVDLRQAVAQLSRQDRALLVLHYWQGLSISECARELDVPEGTTKSRINRALVRLRERLGEGGR